MAQTYTPYKGMTITLYLAVIGGWLTYVLSPGCTITRSVTKELSIFPIEGGKAAELMTLGRNESDTIRIDGKVLSTTALSPSGSETSPAVVDHFTLLSNFKALDNGFINDKIDWGGTELVGRIKSITVTQKPGEGNLYDLAIIFEVGTCIDST